MTAIQIEGKMYLREENPHHNPRFINGIPYIRHEINDRAWIKFNHDHPPILCLFPCEPGQTFEVGKDVELVAIQRKPGNSNWELCEIDGYEPIMKTGYDWAEAYRLIPQNTTDSEINKMAHTLYPEPEPGEPSDPMNDWDWAKESKEQPQAETVEQAALEWLNECTLANRIPTVQGCFIAGSSYERQRTEAIIKKVLERAAENALMKYHCGTFKTDQPTQYHQNGAYNIQIDQQSILNTDYSDLI